MKLSLHLPDHRELSQLTSTYLLAIMITKKSDGDTDMCMLFINRQTICRQIATAQHLYGEHHEPNPEHCWKNFSFFVGFEETDETDSVHVSFKKNPVYPQYNKLIVDFLKIFDPRDPTTLGQVINFLTDVKKKFGTLQSCLDYVDKQNEKEEQKQYTGHIKKSPY
jgi:hypothetical protein